MRASQLPLPAFSCILRLSRLPPHQTPKALGTRLVKINSIKFLRRVYNQEVIIFTIGILNTAYSLFGKGSACFRFSWVYCICSEVLYNDPIRKRKEALSWGSWYRDPRSTSSNSGNLIWYVWKTVCFTIINDTKHNFLRLICFRIKQWPSTTIHWHDRQFLSNIFNAELSQPQSQMHPSTGS